MINKLINTQKKFNSSLLIGFLNEKTPLIRPLFHENSFITDFKKKAELLNTFFAKQYSLIKNESKLPTSLTFYTDNCLSAVYFSHEYVGKIIPNVNPNKAHGHGYISICMLKICGWTIYRPSERIFDRGSKY